MSCYALFRNPDESHYYCVKQCDDNIEKFLSISQLKNKKGFVFAPFRANANCPIVVIRADEISKHIVDNDFSATYSLCNDANIVEEQKKYKDTFNIFHSALKDNHFEKLVLSRFCSQHIDCNNINYKSLFLKACCLYPHQFVALVCVESIGVWLMATPETLLAQNNNMWSTMALAGTQKIDENNVVNVQKLVWGEKEKREQQVVSNYIANCLEKQNIKYTCNKAKTIVAANLAHLQTNFSFTLKSHHEAISLLNVLHPTPAVCGIPKDKAYNFIIENEGYDRKYYSGFAGLFNVDNVDTHLYVTLRCLNINNNNEIAFYAGGGLLKDSVESLEWNETQNKMQTMRQLFY